MSDQLLIRRIEIGPMSVEEDFIPFRQLNAQLVEDNMFTERALQDGNETLLVSTPEDKLALTIGRQLLAALSIVYERDQRLMAETFSAGASPLAAARAAITFEPMKIDDAALIARLGV